jgi:hypothetical protein
MIIGTAAKPDTCDVGEDVPADGRPAEDFLTGALGGAQPQDIEDGCLKTSRTVAGVAAGLAG